MLFYSVLQGNYVTHSFQDTFVAAYYMNIHYSDAVNVMRLMENQSNFIYQAIGRDNVIISHCKKVFQCC